jgi:ADP-ribose pyrophosphatase
VTSGVTCVVMAQPLAPPLPAISLESCGITKASSPGFLELQRTRYRTRGLDGSYSREFVYDSVGRRALDAVIIAAHFENRGRLYVYLRSALRPPLLEREQRETADHQPQAVQLWELPAGLVEAGENSTLGLLSAAARETQEELGFALEPGRFQPLGHGVYPLPAVIGERQFFFHVQVDPSERQTPSLDGSVLEEAGAIFACELGQALELCRNGQILDSKTELGLRRLAEIHAATALDGSALHFQDSAETASNGS